MSLMAIAALGSAGLGAFNSIRGSINDRRNYNRMMDRHNAFMGELDANGLNDPIEMGRLDYGKAYSDAGRLTQGAQRNALSQLNRQISAMNQRSRSLGLPVDSQAAGHAIGGLYGNMSSGLGQTAQGLLGMQMNQNQMQFQADQANRENMLQYLKAKYSPPTQPSWGNGAVGVGNALMGGLSQYESNRSTKSLVDSFRAMLGIGGNDTTKGASSFSAIRPPELLQFTPPPMDYSQYLGIGK